MKRFVLLLMVLAMSAGILCSCDFRKPSPATSSEAGSSEESGESSLPETNSSGAVALQLNTDVFSDIGLTYAQIKAKRGNLIEVSGYEGGISYIFENGYGYYCWAYEDLESSELPTDENGNIINDEAPLPKETVKCFFIGRVKISTLFLGGSESINVSEIGRIENINYGGVHDAAGYDGWQYTVSFSYHDITAVIYSHEEETVNLDSEVTIMVQRNL